MATFTPDSSFASSVPQMVVQIYPINGEKITITGGNLGILQGSVDKNIRNYRGGSFSLHLAPGGLNGVDDPISWTTRIPINSLAVIGLMRGSSRRIVMVGIITDIAESQLWNNKRVTRTIQITGLDFTYYFTAFSYYLLAYLGLLPSNFPTGAAGYLLGIFGKQFGGPPNIQAYYWLKLVMLGVGDPKAQAVLEQTFLYYNGQQYFLKQLIGSWFEAFSEVNTVLYMPFLTDVVNSEGSWMDKFLANLPWPYYEFFITTAESTDYPAFNQLTTSISNTISIPSSSTVSVNVPTTQNQDIVDPAMTTFSLPGFNPVSPVVIGRVNPQPWMEYPVPPVVTSTSTVFTGSTNGNLHTERWNELNTYLYNSYGFINSEVSYSSSDVANFFGVNTTDSSQIAQLVGGNPTNYAFGLLGGVVDYFSVNRFGFRPKWVDLRWLTTFTKTAVPPNQQFTVPLISAVLLGKLASFYIPTYNMLDGKVMIPMWPDVLPGNKFNYMPFKNDPNLYTFYIEGVTHIYNYGGDCLTTLKISRGLKSNDYSNITTLRGILQDSSVRVANVFTPRNSVDLNTNPPGYYISPQTLAALGGVGFFPWNAIPPVVTANSKGWPSGTPSSYDATFANAGSGTYTVTCGSNTITLNQAPIDPTLLKSVGIQESGLNNNAINPQGARTYYGIMQVADNAGYDVHCLQTNPAYNIAAGTQLLGQKLTDNGGDIYNALAAYGGAGATGGYSTPEGAKYVNSVLGIYRSASS